MESRRKLKCRNTASKNTVLPGARVCWFTYVSMMPWVLASTRSVLGGRVTRRSLLSGTLGGRALNVDRVLLLLRECGHNEMRRCGGVDGHGA